MTTRPGNHKRGAPKRKQGNVEIRKDLQDAAHGRDLSYLNEMPQMGGYEGVKAERAATPQEKQTHNNTWPQQKVTA